MNSFRYVILLVATLMITFMYSNRVVFGFTIICQVAENDTRTDYFLTQPVAKAWMFTATAVGMCLGPIPLHWAYRYDTRMLILIYGLISACSTGFYPLFDAMGQWPSLFSRFFAGFAQAGHLYFANEIVLVWAQESESSLFFSLLLTSSQLGPLFTKILGGEMCSSSLGWEATYYILGFLTLVSTVIYVLIYTQDVKTNRFVSDEEVVMIINGRKVLNDVGNVPYRALLADVSIWTSLVMFVGYYIGMIIYQLYSPTFIKQVLHYSVRETGYFSAIPMLFAIFIKVAVGKSIDYGFGLNQKWKLAAPLVILETISAISIFLVGFIDDRVTSLVFNMVFASIHFFVPLICSRTIQIVAAQYAHIALNYNVIIAGLIQILIPGAIHLMVPDNTKGQWTVVFYCLAASIVVTTALYVALVKVRAASWTTPKKEETLYKEGFMSFSRLSIQVN